MTVHKCPGCELRFAFRGDLEDHIRRDHTAPMPRPAAMPVEAPAEVRVLVPLDPAHAPKRAVDVAVGLAGPDTVVELVSVTPPGLPQPVVDAFLAGERDRRPGVRMEVVRLDAPVIVLALLEHIVETAPDLVVLDSHARGPLGELVLGSVSADLVRSSHSPTMLAGPACKAGTKLARFVVAVDGSPDSLEALDVASRLSKRLRVPLELVEVVEEMPYTSDIAESAELHRLAESVEPPVRRWDVLHGHDVARSLNDHVKGDRGAVLVLGTHGRSAGRPNPLGGVAARTVRHAPVPVLVVSPEAASTDAPRKLVGRRSPR
ncbi:MAG TPA: universal stress protein [Acidimicrobiales bacterium]|nr:universal stress protein [Acidimicrobiales bacterium]